MSTVAPIAPNSANHNSPSKKRAGFAPAGSAVAPGSDDATDTIVYGGSLAGLGLVVACGTAHALAKNTPAATPSTRPPEAAGSRVRSDLGGGKYYHEYAFEQRCGLQALRTVLMNFRMPAPSDDYLLRQLDTLRTHDKHGRPDLVKSTERGIYSHNNDGFSINAGDEVRERRNRTDCFEVEALARVHGLKIKGVYTKGDAVPDIAMDDVRALLVLKSFATTHHWVAYVRAPQTESPTKKFVELDTTSDQQPSRPVKETLHDTLLSKRFSAEPKKIEACIAVR